MANNRDVRLGVSIDTGNSAQNLKTLAEQLHGVGSAAAEAATANSSALAAATAEARAAEKAAADAARATRTALAEKREELARLRAAVTADTRATQEHQEAETRLKLAIVDAAAAARVKRQAAADAAAAARAAAGAEREFAESLRQAAAAQRASVATTGEQTTALGTLQGQLQALRNVAAAALGGSLVGSLARDLGDTADAYSNLAARVKLAAGEGDGFAATFAGVFDVAQRTGTAVEDVGALFTKLMQAGKELNLTSADALRLAESVSQAAQLSGASAQEAASAVTQLGQALASGRLQGDELRSILENSPRLARAMADGLGVAVGQLRELGAAGALTSQQVVAALQGQGAALQAEFNALPPTVGRALTNLGNEWTRYVGEVDKATGASSTAARAINALAGNLDTLGAVLASVGKTAAAYAALRLAESFIASATGARALATATTAAAAATAAHTAATVANSAAQVENAAATAATAGRLASLLGTLKLVSFIGVVTNLREIGTALGEGAAKLMGYGKNLAELEAMHKADAEAARTTAAQTAALAQAQQQATDKALGLTDQARKLLGEFDGLRAKGDGVADALAKIAKSADLSDVQGLATFGAALDALALRGKASGDQIRAALAAALQGQDLAVFETNARAAFDNSAQGARRLAAAVDAIALESLRRAGTSLEEMTTGFSKAATSALSDLDALAATLATIKAPAAEAGRVLGAALDKATAAATTERAAAALVAKVEELGRAGMLTGDTLADALEKAKRKLDEVRPGVSSLSEALRLMGLNTRQELQATADKLGAAYATIAQSGQVSLAQQIEAYGKWRAAALAASGGVESGQLKLQGVVLENRAAVAGLGDAYVKAMGNAKTATDAAAESQKRLRDLMLSDPTRLVSGSSGLGGINGTAGNAATTGTGSVLGASGSTSFTVGGSQLRPPDDSGAWEFVQDSSWGTGLAQNEILEAAQQGRPVPRGNVAGIGYWRRRGGAQAPSGTATGGAVAGASTAPSAPTRGPSSAGSARIAIDLTVNRKTFQTGAADRNDADALLAALTELKRSMGG